MVDLSELYASLKLAYSGESLTAISAKLISAYRNRDHLFLNRLIRRLRSVVDIESAPIHRTFVRLVKLYHPDRATWYAERIEDQHRQGDRESLSRLSEIISAPALAESAGGENGIRRRNRRENQSIEEEWDDEDHSEDDDDEDFSDFLSALKHMEYGTLNVTYEEHDLEGIEGELDLSGYGIDDLSGIEHCLNLTSLDLSDNEIDELSRLSGLDLLEELYLADNRIHELSPLRHLANLTTLDLSGNLVADLTPILDLPRLDYLNIVGNPVPSRQVELLIRRGITVIA